MCVSVSLCVSMSLCVRVPLCFAPLICVRVGASECVGANQLFVRPEQCVSFVLCDCFGDRARDIENDKRACQSRCESSGRW